MPRYRLDISYDGTGYSGWQIQPNKLTVQQQIQSAIASLVGKKLVVHGSGRTDQGVHARQQVAHVDIDYRIDPPVLLRGVNALLPSDIRLLKVQEVPKDFHARRSVIYKEYRYFIWNDAVMPPFYRFYRVHVRTPLDVERMQRAAVFLTGRHDFAAFSANPSREVGSTVRTLHRLGVQKKGPEISILVVADGFLYRMARSLAGFLIRVGEGTLGPEAATEILESRQRTARVPTAPPQGLFLWRVRY